MIRRLGALALIGLTATACSTIGFGSHPAPPPPPPPPPAGATHAAPVAKGYLGYRCPPTDPCAPKEKSAHRQYYDAHHRRYYYYDPMTRRYYWEDGAPKT